MFPSAQLTFWITIICLIIKCFIVCPFRTFDAILIIIKFKKTNFTYEVYLLLLLPISIESTGRIENPCDDFSRKVCIEALQQRQ
jgi:hypothetical protein